MNSSTPDCAVAPGDLVAQLREELRPVYREAAQNVPGWEERAVSIATRIGDQLASLRITRSSLVSALRTVDRLLTQAVAVSVGTALQVAAVGTIVAMEVLSGFHEGQGMRDERALAEALLAGRSVPADAGVAGSVFSVIAVRANGSSPTDVENAFRSLAGEVVPSLFGSVSSATGHLLVPMEEDAAVVLCERVRQELFGSVWLCVSERPVGEIPLACKEVDDLLELVTSLGRAPGVYRITDVLFEYAAVATPEVSAELSRVVAPLLANPVLVETLTALVEADGNRALAVKRLFIHRSTIDYRLWQVEQLTGLSPVNPRDLAVLSTALAVSGRAPAS